MAPVGQIVKDFTLARVNLVIGAHAIVQRLRQGQGLEFYRDRKNPYDPENAIMVVVPSPQGKRRIGYLPPQLSKEVGPLLDAGVKVIGRKAPNALYGVCQLAYIPPTPEPKKDDTNDEPTPAADTADSPEGV